MEISETLNLADICILFWEDDSNLPKDGKSKQPFNEDGLHWCSLWSAQDAENKGAFAGRDCIANKQVQIHLT